MWILQFLPDWVFHLILLIGLLGLGASFVLKFIPFVAQYKVPIQVAASILIVLGVYMEGAISNQAWWKARVAEAEARVKDSEVKAAEANTKLAEQMSKNSSLVKENTALSRQRLTQQSTQLNQECKISQSVIDILNDAAKNRKGATQ